MFVRCHAPKGWKWQHQHKNISFCFNCRLVSKCSLLVYRQRISAWSASIESKSFIWDVWCAKTNSLSWRRSKFRLVSERYSIIFLDWQHTQFTLWTHSPQWMHSRDPRKKSFFSAHAERALAGSVFYRPHNAWTYLSRVRDDTSSLSGCREYCKLRSFGVLLSVVARRLRLSIFLPTSLDFFKEYIRIVSLNLLPNQHTCQKKKIIVVQLSLYPGMSTLFWILTVTVLR